MEVSSPIVIGFIGALTNPSNGWNYPWPIGRKLMYPREVVFETLGKDNGWTNVAHPMYDALGSGLISRCMIQDTHRGVMGVRIHLFDLETFIEKRELPKVLFRLECDIVMETKEHKMRQLATALFIDGPVYDEPVTAEDLRMQIGMYLQPWKDGVHHPWREPIGVFEKHRALVYRKRGICQEQPFATPYIASYYGMALASFTASWPQNNELIEKTTSTDRNQGLRKSALRSFGEKFGSMVAGMQIQQHREALGRVLDEHWQR